MSTESDTRPRPGAKTSHWTLDVYFEDEGPFDMEDPGFWNTPRGQMVAWLYEKLPQPLIPGVKLKRISWNRDDKQIIANWLREKAQEMWPEHLLT